MSFNIGNVLSSLGSSIFGNLGSEIGGIIDSPIGQAGLNLLEELAKSVFAGGSNGGPFADKINIGPISLPDPLAGLNPMLNGLGQGITKAADLLGKLGSFLTGGFTALENGTSTNVPGLTQRAGTDAAASSNVASQIGSGAYDQAISSGSSGVTNRSFSSNAVGGSQQYGWNGQGGTTDIYGAGGNVTSGMTGAGGVFDTGLSKEQQSMIDAAGGTGSKEGARLAAQFAMENKAELLSFISNMMKMYHDMQMSIIGNIR